MAGAVLLAPQAGGRHNARGRVGKGPWEAPAEAAAAAAALCPVHNAPGARGAPNPRPPPSPLLTGAIAPGAGNSRAAQCHDLWLSPGPERSPKEGFEIPTYGSRDKPSLSPRPCLSRKQE